jgi:hypothetical protein
VNHPDGANAAGKVSAGRVIWFTCAGRRIIYQLPHRPLIIGAEDWKLQMTAIIRALSRAFPATSPESEILKLLALFCGAGLLVSLILMTYGLDLSAGFF